VKQEYELRLSDTSDWPLFERIASSLEKHFKGQWAKKLDGTDQRYWDLVIPSLGIGVTLHLEHYAGISLRIDQYDVLNEQHVEFTRQLDTLSKEIQ
jgi:hypothetical protein